MALGCFCFLKISPLLPPSSAEEVAEHKHLFNASLLIVVIILAEVGLYSLPPGCGDASTMICPLKLNQTLLMNTQVMGKDSPGQSKALEELNSDVPIAQEEQISLTNFSPKLF